MWPNRVLTSYSDGRIHHKLLPGHMGAVKWYESELWHSSWYLCWGLCDYHRPPNLWEEVESEERCSEFCYSLGFGESYSNIESASASTKPCHVRYECVQGDPYHQGKKSQGHVSGNAVWKVPRQPDHLRKHNIVFSYLFPDTLHLASRSTQDVYHGEASPKRSAGSSGCYDGILYLAVSNAPHEARMPESTPHRRLA